MKIVSRLLMMFAAVSALISCETYGDPEVDKTAVAPLDGRWICLLYDNAEYVAADGNVSGLTPVTYCEVFGSNTSNNESDKMWFNIVNPVGHWGSHPINATYKCATLSVKLDCNPGARTFSVANTTSVVAPPRAQSLLRMGQSTMSLSLDGKTVNIKGGSVVVNGYRTPSSDLQGKDYFADAINFELSFDGNDYRVVGHRYTGWEEDYVYLTPIFEEWGL